MLWGLTPVTLQPASGIAVNRLKHQIHAGLLLPEERLPAERKLADDIGISRVTLREALKLLEIQGYLEVRRGAHGGAFVADEERLQALAKASLARDPAILMRLQEFREVAEPTAARLAATRRDRADVNRLEAGLERLIRAAGHAEIRQAETLIYLALGEASHNPFLRDAIKDYLGEVLVPYHTDQSPHHSRDAATGAFLPLISAIKDRSEGNAEEAAQRLVHRNWQFVRGLAKASPKRIA
jgi:DNA-binding FadR family transcriptional regulator